MGGVDVRGAAPGTRETDLLAPHNTVERVHAIVTRTAPDLAPKTWYGMPAYADADGKVVLFLQVRGKFGTRYCTLGFNDVARLDDGSMWPSAHAVTSIDTDVEQRIEALVTRACGVAEG